jgi:homoserine kinase
VSATNNAHKSVTAFAPATVSNVACGFDVLGFALGEPGDEVTARLVTETDGAAGTAGVGRSSVVIERIEGDGNRLPRDAAKNTAGVAADALLAVLGESRRVALSVRKGLPLSSGLGGSAASAVAAVVAVDALLDAGTPLDTLLTCAFQGERVGAGSAHGDNIAPCLYGGFVLVRRANPPDIVRLPAPDGLVAVVVHPHLEIETAHARALLGETVRLADAIQQWANLGAFVDALHRRDFGLLARSLDDRIAEPRRASLVPGFAAIKASAIDAGALGCSLSGSGPSMFALCVGGAAARRVADAMGAAVVEHVGSAPEIYVSPIVAAGARVVNDDVQRHADRGRVGERG